jgi:hypothetical protein
MDPDPGGQKHMGPTDPDPDPQHCFNTFQELFAVLLDQKLTCGTACQHTLSLHNSYHVKLADCLASDHFIDAKK